MKKSKLNINRETIRNLDRNDLIDIQGGSVGPGGSDACKTALCQTRAQDGCLSGQKTVC